jgi:hypothetical protein
MTDEINIGGNIHKGCTASLGRFHDSRYFFGIEISQSTDHFQGAALTKSLL